MKIKPTKNSFVFQNLYPKKEMKSLSRAKRIKKTLVDTLPREEQLPSSAQSCMHTCEQGHKQWMCLEMEPK